MQQQDDDNNVYMKIARLFMGLVILLILFDATTTHYFIKSKEQIVHDINQRKNHGK